MNFAAPALLILLLVLPGALFRYTYHRDVSEGEVIDPRPFSAETILSLLVAGAFHLIWCSAAWLLHDLSDGAWPRVDTTAALALLFGTGSNGFSPEIRAALEHPGYIAGYFVSLYVAAWCAGGLAQQLVIGLELDQRWGGLFRFKSPWLYAFGKGDISVKQITRRIRNNGEDAEPFDAVVVAVTLELADRAWIYSGILVAYRTDRDGNLKYLTLALASRRPLEDEDADFVEIEGDHFIVDYARVATLNIHHVWFEGYEEASETPLTAAAPAVSQSSPEGGAPAASSTAHSSSL